jgi:hypothetical protein
VSATLLVTNGRLFRGSALKHKQARHHAFKRAAFAIMGMLVTGLPAIAQDAAAPATPKWRPTDGLYAAPGAQFNASCGEYGDVIVDLAGKEISGNEWSCKVVKLTGSAPGAIWLNMICDDYNLAESLGDRDPNFRKFREVMLLRRIDEKSVFVRKTLNGKFEGPEYRAAYCPQEWQRTYVENMARNKAEAEQKAVKEK